MLRWSAARYRTEVRMHAEVRGMPATFLYSGCVLNEGVLKKRAAGLTDSPSSYAGLIGAASLDNSLGHMSLICQQEAVVHALGCDMA